MSLPSERRRRPSLSLFSFSTHLLRAPLCRVVHQCTTESCRVYDVGLTPKNCALPPLPMQPVSASCCDKASQINLVRVRSKSASTEMRSLIAIVSLTFAPVVAVRPNDDDDTKFVPYAGGELIAARERASELKMRADVASQPRPHHCEYLFVGDLENTLPVQAHNRPPGAFTLTWLSQRVVLCRPAIMRVSMRMKFAWPLASQLESPLLAMTATQISVSRSVGRSVSHNCRRCVRVLAGRASEWRPTCALRGVSFMCVCPCVTAIISIERVIE